MTAGGGRARCGARLGANQPVAMSDLRSLLSDRALAAGIHSTQSSKRSSSPTSSCSGSGTARSTLRRSRILRWRSIGSCSSPLWPRRTCPSAEHLADLGSGGGSPAIPLALALRAPRLLMVESRSRKAAFLREAARMLELSADVVAIRFEEFIAHAGLRGLGGRRVDAGREAGRRLPWKSPAGWLVQAAPSPLITSVHRSREIRRPNKTGCSTWNITPSAMLVTFHVKHT